MENPIVRPRGRAPRWAAGIVILVTCLASSQGCGSSDSGADGGVASGDVDAAACPMAALLEQNCQSCHAAKPVAGAPMPLVTWNDLMAPSHSDPARHVYEMVKVRTNATDKFMPPTGHLTEQQLGVIDAWMNAGEPNCGFASGAKKPGGTVTGTADDSDGGVSENEVIKPEACYEIHAHGEQTPGDSTPFTVAPSQFYHAFNFKVPYDKDVKGLIFKSLIDNSAVVHHWLLYQVNGTPDADGTHKNTGGMHTNDTLLFGWAPGGAPPSMPPGVGFQMPKPGSTLQLEIHYYNTTGMAQPDRTGMSFCVTSKPTKYTAATTTLGSELILLLPAKTGTATGTCNPGFKNGKDKRDIHILYSSPHMHKTGVRMTTIINRVGGEKETLIDKPFAFLEQHDYPTPVIIHPGDTLTTTCTFDNMSSGIVTYGPSTTQEMCYNFVVAYPADLLANPGGSLQGADNTCLQ